MITLSASGLPRAEKCPASCTLPRAGRLSAANERGTKLHDIREAATPDGAEVAFALNIATMKARQLGERRHQDLGARQPGDDVRGAIDKLIVEPERVVVRDYKSGFGYQVAPPAENLQLGFFAVCAADVHGKDAARVEIEFIDQERTSSADLDAFDLMAMRERIRAVWRRVHAPEPQIVEGEHCSMCACYARCPAKTNLGIAVANGELAQQLPTLELTDEAVAKGWLRLKQVKKLIGEVEKIYRGYAAENAVPLGGSKYLGEHVNVSDVLSGPVAFAVLKEMHGEEVAKAAVTMETSKAALERALAPIAPPRGKAQMVRNALAAIEKAGGVSQTYKRTVEEYEDRNAKAIEAGDTAPALLSENASP